MYPQSWAKYLKVKNKAKFDRSRNKDLISAFAKCL